MAYGYITEGFTDYQSLKSRLWPGGLLQGTDHFDVLNQHLRHGMLEPGQLVLVPDASSATCSIEEARLMRYAEEISHNLKQQVTVGRVGFDNYDLVQSFLAYSSIGVGSATSAWRRHLDEVGHTLEEIERLHRRLKDGGLDRDAFIRQRQALFGLLETQLQGAARFGTGLRGNPLKRALGISTKSYLHQGEIAGYAQHVQRIAQMSKWLGKGTYVGLALDVNVAALEIKEACMTGREAQCRSAKYVETGRLAGGVAGAAFLGRVGADAARRACVMFLGVRMKGSGARLWRHWRCSGRDYRRRCRRRSRCVFRRNDP
ncbi:hypothetical protein [Pseudomonas sp. MPB26]|uniref:hypothetical protein n=1 Tax=Pseudomonas sp. MPB26 TaxID=3388491 RepID=UPI003984E614